MKPTIIQLSGEFRDWHTGELVEMPRTRTLIYACSLRCNFWTWIDDSGERAWEYAGKLST